ncbi:MAG: hypothetical protein RIC85_01120 [Gammaproteobacteria bacterium]
MDNDQLRSVAEDLEYLKEDWHPEITEPDIRRGSATLRRLLVEDAYGKAWRQLGNDGQPRLIAVDLDLVLGGVDHANVYCVIAWGARFRGLEMASPCIAQSSDLPIPPDPIRTGGFPGEREFSLSEYMDSDSGVAESVRVSRRDIIKYVANVKGGVHLGQKTKRKEKDLIKRVGKFEQRAIANTTDGLLVEIVAIAQAVGESEAAIELAKQIRDRI